MPYPAHSGFAHLGKVSKMRRFSKKGILPRTSLALFYITNLLYTGPRKKSYDAYAEIVEYRIPDETFLNLNCQSAKCLFGYFSSKFNDRQVVPDTKISY